MSLEEARNAIDKLDRAIVRLLDDRAKVGREIAGYKKALGLPLRNPEREEQVIAGLNELSDGAMPARSLANIYRVIMAETLALQADLSPCGASQERHGAKKDIDASIVENNRVAPGFYRMRLNAPAFEGLFLPGQFFQLRVGGWGEGLFLRRPFAPCSNEAGEMTFYYAVVGAGTSRMTSLKSGDRVKVLAPLGNAYRLPAPGARALLLGGGFGGPSLASLAKALKREGLESVVLLGARTSEAVLEQRAFAKLTDRLIIATDDGSHGCKGTVIDAFQRERENLGTFQILYACGPLPMLRAAAKLAEELKIECQVSLEERMACGFGACMGCVVPVRDGKGGTVYRRVCHDGPVFDAQDLAWEEIR